MNVPPTRFSPPTNRRPELQPDIVHLGVHNHCSTSKHPLALQLQKNGPRLSSNKLKMTSNCYLQLLPARLDDTILKGCDEIRKSKFFRLRDRHGVSERKADWWSREEEGRHQCLLFALRPSILRMRVSMLVEKSASFTWPFFSVSSEK